VCLAVAAILWFLNALNKEYIVELTYPVKYSDLPGGKTLVSELPRELFLEVKAHGFALLRHKIATSFLPIVFNVNSDVLRNQDVVERVVSANEIKERVSSQFNSDIQLLHVRPESIHFRFSRLKRKKVPVKADVHYTLRHQHVLKKEIAVNPDSVVMEGPAPLVDTLRVVRTRPLVLENLARSVSREVGLVEIHGLRPSLDKVRVDVEVEQTTEAARSVTVVTRNVPPHLRLRLFPPTVEVTYSVGLSRYDQARDASFLLSVDYRQVADSPDMLPVKVEKAPSFITNLSISPKQVEYLIEQK
jgi:hypothetical protein